MNSARLTHVLHGFMGVRRFIPYALPATFDMPA